MPHCLGYQASACQLGVGRTYTEIQFAPVLRPVPAATKKQCLPKWGTLTGSGRPLLPHAKGEGGGGGIIIIIIIK